jgi:hypothetical protein
MSACFFRSTSIKTPPLRSFLTDLGVPIKAVSCFSIMKGLSSVSDLELFDLIIRKRGKLPSTEKLQFESSCDFRFFLFVCP